MGQKGFVNSNSHRSGLTSLAAILSLGLVIGPMPAAYGAYASLPAGDTGPITLPEPGTAFTSDAAALEEGKALYENGQLIAALGKFMTVLRKDPHNPEARQYLRMIVDTLRQNPSISASKLGTREQAVATNPLVQEEIRRMLQLRSRLTMDLRAIPGIRLDVKSGVNQAKIDTAILFDENSGGLKEQGIPMLDRVAAWLKTFGQQPVIIHCYPEEFQEPSSNGSLFLRRYSELFNFFVEERKLPAQRFVSADLLKGDGTAPESRGSRSAGEKENEGAAGAYTGAPMVVIETIGAQSGMLDAMPSSESKRVLSQWLEDSIVPNRRVFNPEEGEWVNLDLAALSRTGLRRWSLQIIPVEGKNPAPVFKTEGTGNLLRRLSWDGHDQKTGDFVRAGHYLARLSAINSDGTIKNQEEVLQVERTTKEAPVMAEKPKPKAKPTAKAKKPVAKAAVVAKVPSPDGSTALPDPTPLPPPTPVTDNSEESIHAIWKQVVQFEPNQSELMPTLKSSLERIGKTLEVYPLQKVRITGFAMASEADANALAAKRAEKVRSILVNEYHVDAKRVLVAGGKVISGDNGSKVEMSITN